jgi:GWxTD domain-containing protein
MVYKRRYRKNKAGYIILASILFSANVSAQVETTQGPKEFVSNIIVEAFTFKSDSSGKGRLDMYVQIPYTEINFMKENEVYLSRLEIAATVLTQEKQEVWQRNQMVELQVKDFGQTISHQRSQLKQFSTDLLPGKYELHVQISDHKSKKITTIQKSLTVKDFSKDSLGMSDLMMASKIGTLGTRKSIVPNLTGHLTNDSSSVYIFFEVYHQVQLDSMHLLCKFINTKKEVVSQYKKKELLTENQTQIIWQIDTPMLVPSRYDILIEATGFTQSKPPTQLRSSASRTCQVLIKGMPLMISDIDKATDELIYIAKGSELDYIRESGTQEEKQKRFLEFWTKRDPDPKTERNELMEEYYTRVDYANKNYSNYREGWRSDRGMVLIRFGAPQNVERHPFESDSKPYEIWYYYDQNRKFTFVDETGFSDYRLLYPETDLWGRIR